MSKPARKSRVTQQLEILALRTLELSDQVAVGQLKFIDAGDAAYESANATGVFRYVLHRDVAGARAARPTIGQGADVVVRRLLHR
jgi:hypothetical protein